MEIISSDRFLAVFQLSTELDLVAVKKFLGQKYKLTLLSTKKLIGSNNNFKINISNSHHNFNSQHNNVG